MHKEGKFVHLGISNFTAYELAEVAMTCRAHGWVRPKVAQYMYNAISELPVSTSNQTLRHPATRPLAFQTPPPRGTMS